MSFQSGSGRGVVRGTGRGGGRGTWGRSHWQPRAEQPPTKPLGEIVNRINVKTLLVDLETPVIQDVKYISSYNWLDSKSPIVLVPGSPPAWSPLTQDIKLKRDSQDVFRDINAAHYPAYPMEPAIRSIRAMKPDYELQNVDIIGCGSTIGNLLRCAASQQRAFRFDLNIVRDTLFFIRRESSPTELIMDLQGFGHTFPEKYTTWDIDVRNSCSHQRIISYDFGGLQLLVRSETDGYLKEVGTTASQEADQSASGEDLAEVLNKMAVSSAKPSADEKLEVRLRGTEISQDRIFDIKTRASYKIYDMNDILPRLWLNQTPNFLLAYHEFGLFNKPKVQCVREDVLRWQSNNSPVLARFHALLKRIIDVVRDSEDECFEVSWDGEGPLLISRQIGEGRKTLPSDLYDFWQI